MLFKKRDYYFFYKDNKCESKMLFKKRDYYFFYKDNKHKSGMLFKKRNYYSFFKGNKYEYKIQKKNNIFFLIRQIKPRGFYLLDS